MRMALFVLFLCSSLPIRAAAPCYREGVLKAAFKIKDILYVKMAERNFPKEGPLQCQLLDVEDKKQIMRMIEIETAKCFERTGEEEGRLQRAVDIDLPTIIAPAVSALDLGNCDRRNVEAEFNSFVSQNEHHRSADTLCRAYSPFHQGLMAKARTCREEAKRTASNDPNSCEIADVNGRCPGAPLVQAQPEPTPVPQRKNQTRGFIHWGEQGASAR